MSLIGWLTAVVSNTTMALVQGGEVLGSNSLDMGIPDQERQEGDGVKKYIVIYHATAAALEQMQDATPEEMAEGREPWMAWAERSGDGLVDMGTPLGGGQKITKSGTSPSDKGVVGYSVLQAENMEAAQALVMGHPHLDWAAGCEIKVHESLPLPG